ncbi:hypothetical protein [Streptomyces caelestis]
MTASRRVGSGAPLLGTVELELRRRGMTGLLGVGEKGLLSPRRS